MTTNASPSDTVLDETPARALKFLGGVGHNASIHALLAARGYTPDVHEQGWGLLLEASGYRNPHPPLRAVLGGSLAFEQIDAWDEPNFRVAHAALDFEFPEQSAFLFDGLAAASGPGAIVSVTTLLDRLDVLESGEGRAATHDRDTAALAKLSARGITSGVRSDLRTLLAKAVLAAPLQPVDTTPPPPDVDPAAARVAKIALHAWYGEWALVARADIKRRDYLIQLGLASRKARKRADESDAGPKSTTAK